MKKQVLLFVLVLIGTNMVLVAQPSLAFPDSIIYHQQKVSLQVDNYVMVFTTISPLTSAQVNAIGYIQDVESVAKINALANRYAVHFVTTATPTEITTAKNQIGQIVSLITEAPVVLNYVPDSFALARQNLYTAMVHYNEAKNSVLENNHQRRFIPAKRLTIELKPIEGEYSYDTTFNNLATTYNLTAINDTNNTMPENVKAFNVPNSQSYVNIINTLNTLNTLPYIDNSYLQFENDYIDTEEGSGTNTELGSETCSADVDGFVWHNNANGKIGSWAIGANDLQIAFDSDGDGDDELLSIADNGWATLQAYNDGVWDYVWSNFGNWWLGEVDLGRLAGYVVMQNGDATGKEHILFVLKPKNGGIGQSLKREAKLVRFATTKWAITMWSGGSEFYDINGNGPYSINVSPRFTPFDHDGDGKDDLFYLDALGNAILWYFTPGNAGKWKLNTRWNGSVNTWIGGTNLSNIQAVYALRADSLDTADELLCINTLWANLENFDGNTWTQKFSNNGTGYLDNNVTTFQYVPSFHKLSDLDFYMIANVDGGEVAEEITSFEKYANNNWIEIQSYNTHPGRVIDGFQYEWCNWGEGSVYDKVKLSDKINLASIKLCSTTNKDLTLIWAPETKIKMNVWPFTFTKKMKGVAGIFKISDKISFYKNETTNNPIPANIISSHIYPNPAINHAKINISSTAYIDKIDLQITDINGRVFVKKNMLIDLHVNEEATFDIDIENWLPTGNYILTLHYANKIINTYKLLVL